MEGSSSQEGLKGLFMLQLVRLFLSTPRLAEMIRSQFDDESRASCGHWLALKLPNH